LIEVRRYESKDKPLWNEFIASAKNATFLFNRDFMDYHKERFEDYSLLCLKKGKLVAVLPANYKEEKLYSHQGLTYGGLIIQSKMKLEDYTLIFEITLKYLSKNKIEHLILKELPAIYTSNPSGEFEYIQFLLEASIIRVDVSSTIKKSTKMSFSSSRKEGCKRAIKRGLKIIEEDEMDTFWNEILIPNLKEKHNTCPVHSLDEIKQLKQSFPKSIRQFNVYDGNKLVAGTTVFETNKVAHSQYISGNQDRSKLGSLDFLHHYLISEVFQEKAFFDFGISTENQGKLINKGLLFWKEGFGARATTYKTYKIETKNYKKLSQVFI